MKIKDKIFPACMAILWCLVFGSAMHNWTLGVCMGLCMGVAFGLFGDGKDEKGMDPKQAEDVLPDLEGSESSC